MAEEKQRKTSTEERIFEKIVDLKTQTTNGEIEWTFIDLENPSNENHLQFIEDLESNEHIKEQNMETYKVCSGDKIFFVGKLIIKRLDENDDLVRESDYFITISDMKMSIKTTYRDSILQAKLRKDNQFNYSLAISNAINGGKSIYSSEIYRLIREIKVQILNI